MRITALVLLLASLSGCSAMMMGGDSGYEAPSDECSEADREAGKCG